MGCVVLVVCLLCSPPFLLSSSSSLCVVFGVVRAQLCEHARYPRTPTCPLLFSVLFCSSARFFARRLSFVGMAVGVHHVSVCWVGMTAMGSLSLSPSFFW